MNVKVFEYQYQVEPKDIDALHHVNNVVYLQYVQDAATKHWTELRNCKEITYPFWLVLLPFFYVSNFAKRRKLLATICALKKNKITTPILYTLFLYNSLSIGKNFDAYVWVVGRHEIDYIRPALLGDLLIIKTWVGSTEGSSSVRHVEIYKNNKIITRTQTLWRLLDSKTFKPIAIPSEILEV